MIKLTTNKFLYKGIVNNQDSFGDRLTLCLIHFAFILREFKDPKNEKQLQDLYDFTFRQLELSIREVGYGDQSINKKMKDYINLFYSMLDKIHEWDQQNIEKKKSILLIFLDNSVEVNYMVNYFDKYKQDLANNTLNFYLKGVVKL